MTSVAKPRVPVVINGPRQTVTGTGTIITRDAPDTVFAGYPAGRIPG
jgi:hypothetical protein